MTATLAIERNHGTSAMLLDEIRLTAMQHLISSGDLMPASTSNGDVVGRRTI
ncbi:hypothetical protein AWB69_03061 [Caballeronia udeis]|uniref:Uncharacterized protein n=1 Tax=Caballeronia udeis TaxID=1232866 RepID=A0A158GQQ7_9BURK|nr:hypothetical protein AWB69_03061 [Caballeronia udeis]